MEISLLYLLQALRNGIPVRICAQYSADCDDEPQSTVNGLKELYWLGKLGFQNVAEMEKASEKELAHCAVYIIKRKPLKSRIQALTNKCQYEQLVLGDLGLGMFRGSG